MTDTTTTIIIYAMEYLYYYILEYFTNVINDAWC